MAVYVSWKFDKVQLWFNFGVWRSLVARSAGGREVAGSNPVTPIYFLSRVFDDFTHQKLLFFWSPFQMIPNCCMLCTSAILKTSLIRLFFFKYWILTHVFSRSQVQKSSCWQACSGFPLFCPWHHHIDSIEKILNYQYFSPANPKTS